MEDMTASCSSSWPAPTLQRQDLEPGLYLVSTPIGNLADITLRALTVLTSANLVLAEDTRHTRKLLNHYNIKAELQSYHQHNETARVYNIMQRLQGGEVRLQQGVPLGTTAAEPQQVQSSQPD
ncbi:TP_methylase domain-containing protein [Haematococcus lacustris]|uniref:TP_methylase domain-containing protein n=1 Tax=Haematococcus lacustris TaxID=44745 RepID=A0A699ZG71_HAELA|nr:TP_methylase domain-containing protein [Haematococcus lacustris]